MVQVSIQLTQGNTIEEYQRKKKEEEEQKKKIDKALPTSTDLVDLKHDIRFLYDLGQLDQVAAEDKKLRRKRKRIIKAETNKEMEAIENSNITSEIVLIVKTSNI